jgi:hypothetical protein
MTPQTSIPTPTSTTAFTQEEQRALRKLRTRYQQDADLFSQRELAHLCFLRWLFQTGQLAP